MDFRNRASEELEKWATQESSKWEGRIRQWASSDQKTTEARWADFQSVVTEAGDDLQQLEQLYMLLIEHVQMWGPAYPQQIDEVGLGQHVQHLNDTIRQHPDVSTEQLVYMAGSSHCWTHFEAAVQRPDVSVEQLVRLLIWRDSIGDGAEDPFSDMRACEVLRPAWEQIRRAEMSLSNPVAQLVTNEMLERIANATTEPDEISEDAWRLLEEREQARAS